MAIFVIDPSGEFSKDVRGEVRAEGFPLNLSSVLSQLNKEVIVRSVRDLVLDRWSSFNEILYESPFFERLFIPKGENRRIACDILAGTENSKGKLQSVGITLENLHQRESFEKAWRFLGEENIQKQFYRSEQSRERFKIVYSESNRDEFYRYFWLPITDLFKKDRSNAISVDALIKKTFETQGNNLFGFKRPVVIIDLSREMATDFFGMIQYKP